MNIKAVIGAEYDSQYATVNQGKQEIQTEIFRVNTDIKFTNKLKGKPITVKSFLSMQESVTNTRESVTAIESLKDSLKLINLSF